MSTRNVYKCALWLLLVVCVMSFALLFLRQIMAGRQAAANSAALHFIAVLPAQDDGVASVQESIAELAQSYGLQVETHAFSTVTEQRQMLRLLPNIKSDGLLFWPISSNEADYQEELLACRDTGIPIVVIDRDIAADLRSSFIGSGVDSDLLVLNQSLRELSSADTFMVGDRSGSGANQMVELLTFSTEKPENLAFSTQDIQGVKLQQLAETPPEGWYTFTYLHLEGEEARSLQLKYKMIDLFLNENPRVFFSLDSELTATAASAKSSLLASNGNVQILGYGTLSENTNYLTNQLVNGLVTSKPELSAAIGIRYLRDICRGFWIPESRDSGINFITPDSLDGYIMTEGDGVE